MRPVVERPADRHLDEWPRATEAGAGLGVLDVALPDPIEPDVVGHHARVVAEPELGGDVEGPFRQRPVRRPEPTREGSRDAPDRRHAALHHVALDVGVHGGQVFVRPAVAADLVAPGEDRLHAVRERDQGVTGHEPGARDRLAVEEGEDPRSADPRPELAPGAEHGTVAPVDLGRDRVVVEGERDGQPRHGVGHRGRRGPRPGDGAGGSS